MCIRGFVNAGCQFAEPWMLDGLQRYIVRKGRVTTSEKPLPLSSRKADVEWRAIDNLEFP